ncbi:unnamed protein product [Cochlearia groenlandica]
MENQPENARFTMRLLIDEKRSKVVLAETCRDFVDVLFSLLALPMGTIVRLLDKHHKLQQPETLDFVLTLALLSKLTRFMFTSLFLYRLYTEN